MTLCEQLEGLVREHISDLQQQLLQIRDTEIQSKNTQMLHPGAQCDGRDEVDFGMPNKIGMPVFKLQCLSPHQSHTVSTIPTSMQKQI